ncbi:cupin domain-containing protein [Glacieibacterium frigidum]|uniref:Cupin domain-containing protein n=1 Tax=Glacieibacterium frigidum TaxID=2593303 RepID=A0A552UJY6_9SPHN|nr:cupin domain-containing protein [Glacieibacterium frigidum]TRW18481.1 cupin domain-containing protein [Glacieibacterium frigidum]
MHLTNFDAPAFLRDTWQRRPLLIRNPWAAWANPLEPDELAGLACEDGVEARIVTTKRKGYVLEQGPFAEKRFAKAGKKPWTLLVQAVDTYDPDVAALREAFRFIPDWRIDDVMVSYASDGGGVGPHYDQYDVFLVQGLGRRRWQIGGMCDAATPLQPHDDLRLLADFQATEEWVLEPGDMLYIPPGIAHHGVAVGDDCMTYSIGFRAPSRADLIGHWADDLIAGLADDDRYADPGLSPQANPGEIAPDAVARLHAMVTSTMKDPAVFARWFGRYVTERKYDDAPEVVPEGTGLRRNPASRFAFVRRSEGVLLFADGACFDCTGDMVGYAEALCAGVVGAPSFATRELIAALVAQGSLVDA